MDDGNPLYALVIFIVFVIANAVIYAFDAALQGLNETDIEKKAADGSAKDAKLLNYLQRPARLTVTIYLLTGFMAVVVGYFQLGVYAESVRRWMIGLGVANVLNDFAIYLIAYLVTAVYLMLILIALGMYLPKRIGMNYSKQTAYLLLPMAGFFVFVCKPFTSFIMFFSNLILRIIGIDPEHDEVNMTEDEIIHIVNEGHEQGILEEREAEMISNIMKLDNKVADDIMVHRKNIVAIDGEWILKDTVMFIGEQSYSRYPVFIDDIDNVIGILHIKDVLNFYRLNTYDDMAIQDITGLIRKPEFIPQTRNLDDLFKEMQANKNHMEIVVDEYGQTAGLVAMEDILEEIVGNILDEHDTEEHNIIKETDNIYLVKGLTTLEELQEKLDITFDEEEFDTINGYIISKLDRIPERGEKPEVSACGCTFRVLEVNGKIITSVEIIKQPDEESECVKMKEN